jgi:TatD DNase family protein
MIVDSHCHLDFDEFRTDLDEVIERALENGVTEILTICTHISRFQKILEIAEKYSNVWCTVGVHPHEAESEGQKTTEHLIELSRHPKVIGIGETGLDFHYNNSSPNKQCQNFITHIVAAQETGLPLVIHSRDADGAMIEILESEYKACPFTGVMHCFSSGLDLALRSIDIGLYISFSGIITFKKAQAVRDIVNHLPLNKLLVETDAPFLAPVPNRGKRNEPSFVVHTLKELADIINVNEQDLMSITTNNFHTLFDTN